MSNYEIIIEIPESIATCPLGGSLMFDVSVCQFCDEDGVPVSALSLARAGCLFDATKYVKSRWKEIIADD